MKKISQNAIQNEIYKSIERQTPAVLCQFDWDPDDGPKFIYAEGKLKSDLGFNQPTDGMRFWQCISAPDRNTFLEEISQSAKSLEAFTWEGLFHTPDAKRWLRAYFEPKETQNRMVWSGVITDISGLKKKEDTYQEMQDLLHETEQMAKIGSWKLDLKTMVPVWSKEVYKIYELELQDNNDLTVGLKCYPGDACDTLQNAIKLAVEKGVGYDLELPFISTKGSKKWVRTIGKAKFDDGQVIKLYGVIQDITEQKETEERRRIMDSLLSEAETLSHCGSWEANLVTGESLWSEEAFRIFGHKPLKNQGLSIHEYEKIIHPDDFKKYKDVLTRAIRMGKPCNYDFRLLMPSGEIKHVQSIGKPILDENGKTVKLFGAIQDITDRKRIEEDLLLKQAQLSTFITSSPVAISMLDKDLNYLAASNVWIKEYMKEGVEIIGKNQLDLFPELDNKWLDLFRRGVYGETLSCEEDSYVKSDGSIGWLKWEIRPWFEKEEVVGGIIVYTANITHSKLAREELIKTKEKAEEAARVKSQFLSTMSHEIRTPMNAVIGLTKLLIENNPRIDQIKNLSTLQFSAKNLLQIINDILDLNKIEAGKIEFECIKFDLYDLVGKIKDSLEPQASEKQIHLTLEVDDQIPEFVWGDPIRLAQVLTNLLNNALKFTLKGTVKIRLSLKKQKNTSVKIKFAIEDTGIGIAKDKLAYIFENFTQASSETTRRFGGTGLGLSISRRLLELQGITLKVKSKLEVGSVFGFDMVFKNSSNHSAEKPLNALTPRKSLKGLKILLAEDNKINVMVAKQFLTKWDVALDVAEDGASALEMVKQKDYDLVLMDLSMPKMDGYMATIAIKSLNEEKYKSLPVIALTASAMAEIREQALEAGMVDYISKPFDPEILYNKIVRYTNSAARTFTKNTQK